ITCTPTFADKKIPGVPFTLQAIADRGIPIRIAIAGDRFAFGDVTLDVLHPPEIGPEGNENSRSMVVLLRHGGHSILLTGDLEKQGLTDLLAKRAPRIDVLMAPTSRQPLRQHARIGNVGIAEIRRLVPGTATRTQSPKSLPGAGRPVPANMVG